MTRWFGSTKIHYGCRDLQQTALKPLSHVSTAIGSSTSCFPVVVFLFSHICPPLKQISNFFKPGSSTCYGVALFSKNALQGVENPLSIIPTWFCRELEKRRSSEVTAIVEDGDKEKKKKKREEYFCHFKMKGKKINTVGLIWTKEC